MNWERFTKKLVIQAPPSTIYQHWAQAILVEKWFLRNCNYITYQGQKRPKNESTLAGDSYIWEWYNWDGQEKGQVINSDPNRLLVFSFSGAEVEVSLDKLTSGTLVSLTQSKIPIDDENKFNVFYGCGTAWSFWLTNLKAFIEHGIVLHDKNAPLKGPLDMIEFVNV
jgi:uncharacterized protein YndB with AHSA1/START domain